jgi:hypothetical protein
MQQIKGSVRCVAAANHCERRERRFSGAAAAAAHALRLYIQWFFHCS